MKVWFGGREGRRLMKRGGVGEVVGWVGLGVGEEGGEVWVVLGRDDGVISWDGSWIDCVGSDGLWWG